MQGLFVYTLSTKRERVSIRERMFLYDLYIENWQKGKGKGFLYTLLKCDIDRGQGLRYSKTTEKPLRGIRSLLSYDMRILRVDMYLMCMFTAEDVEIFDEEAVEQTAGRTQPYGDSDFKDAGKVISRLVE